MQKTDKDLARKCLEKESIDEKLIVTAGESGSLLEREAFLSAKKGFSVPLGITDDDHQIVVRDFSSIPHVLIGGSTGTGKSSFIRTMLAVLFLHHSPSEVKAIIYDSKGIEYSLFTQMPHLLMPVFSESRNVLGAISWLNLVMQERQKLLVMSGYRDMKKFNEAYPHDGAGTAEIFFILDDFASVRLDGEYRDTLYKVLRDGRAAGIHIIVVSSILSDTSGKNEMLSYIPCRICFSFPAKSDYQKVLGVPAAYRLGAPGEMIYRYHNDMFKCQSAYASYKNIENVMNKVYYGHMNQKVTGQKECSNGEDTPLISDGVQNFIDQFTTKEYTETPEEYDQYLYDAGRLVIEKQKGSIGMIQRCFKIGFNRAAHIMDQLEELGVVGSEIGTSPRTVRMTADEWEEKSQEI